MSNTFESNSGAAQDTPACDTIVETDVGNEKVPPDCSQDGLDTNNRAIAPNNSNTMQENATDATTTGIADCTTTPEEIKSVVPNETITETEATPKVATAPDPFDPANIRINPEYSVVSVKRNNKTLPCQKPSKQVFVRARPGDWSIDVILVKEEGTENYYLVRPDLHEYIVEDCFYARLTLAITQGGDQFLWLQKLPGRSGRSNRWNDSMLEAVKHAETSWVRVNANMHAQCYEFDEAPGITAEPQWTDLTFPEILRLAFNDRHIDSLNHPFLKRLRGKV